MKIGDKVWVVFENTKTLTKTRAKIVALSSTIIRVQCDGQSVVSSVKFTRPANNEYPAYEKRPAHVKPNFHLEAFD
jgi:hypothetical protein